MTRHPQKAVLAVPYATPMAQSQPRSLTKQAVEQAIGSDNPNKSRKPHYLIIHSLSASHVNRYPTSDVPAVCRDNTKCVCKSGVLTTHKTCVSHCLRQCKCIAQSNI